ncbi:hypothetical protein V8C37DRAFT_311262 [Trichoderma ceciliae]
MGQGCHMGVPISGLCRIYLILLVLPWSKAAGASTSGLYFRIAHEEKTYKTSYRWIALLFYSRMMHRMPNRLMNSISVVVLKYESLD